MQYTLMIWTDESVERDELEAAEIHQSVQAWVRDLTERAVLLADQRLSRPEDTTTVRVRDGEVVLGDGPFAETKEQIVGFVTIEAANLDEAIEIAASNPLARIGVFEVRPLWGQ